MSTKTIKLKLLTQQDLVHVVTEATTLEEFKKEQAVMDLNIDWSSTKLIDRATRATLEIDEAVMPSVDSIMFITPTKTKSGIGLSYNEAKTKVQQLIKEGRLHSINFVGKTTADLNALVDGVYNKESVEDVIEEVADGDILIAELTTLLKKAGKKLKKLSKVTGRNTASLVDHVAMFKKELAEFVTKDDLTLEAESLANRF